MAKISLTHPHDRDPADVKQQVDELAQKLKANYGVSCHWEGETLCFERSGLSGQLEVQPQQVAVDVKLGMLYSPMKGKIESELKKVLAEKLE